jgi:hypothetical protein
MQPMCQVLKYLIVLVFCGRSSLEDDRMIGDIMSVYVWVRNWVKNPGRLVNLNFILVNG